MSVSRQRTTERRGLQVVRDVSESPEAGLLRLRDEAPERFAGALYDRYKVLVNRLIRRLLGPDDAHNDVVHDAFVHMLAGAKSVRDPEGLEGWVRVVATNTVRKEIRRRGYRRRLRAQRAEVKLQTASVLPDPPRPEGAFLVRRTYALLDRLPTEQRIAFVLRYVEQHSLGDAAAIAETSLSTFKRRLNAASRKFARLAKNDPFLSDRLDASGGADHA